MNKEPSMASHSFSVAPDTYGTVPKPDWQQLDATTLLQFQKKFGHSLHIRHIDVGSCNACESEVLALSNPYYNFHRLGLFFASSPRHADVLLVTGALTKAMKDVLMATYEAMPRPRIVIAAGVCPIHGGLFRDSAQFVGPIESVIPVDAYIPGCPPTPYALIHGLLLASGRMEEGAERA
ncbi:NADH-quinone oxidoreductase subunit B family protein [Alicyclobacillus sp. ALC3]|uniref:NADH-quinone oxidoreductase subunit B family protein n=1 Tax=Alicyclobacillus sp. ALC3 TaxID=2796143 RepID=UPI002378DD39|nr:NADH-quinone oxidoreductase subunit B family protein [Alicyclobacillus sp. ALC3]WDL98180.1 NADH-quinone oxidoreductase subunit B family protein [Alicyclobacillus sp. ALC3]